MKIVVNSVAVLVAACLGLAVGLALRSKRISGNSESGAAALKSRVGQEAQGAGPHDERQELRPTDDSPLATKLERDLAKSSGVTRWLYWLDAVEKAAPSDFPRLARLAQHSPAALEFVAARWAQIAPRQMFDTLVGATRNGSGFPVREMAPVLFREWPKSDADAAIAALNEPGELGPRHYWREEVATTIINNDFERGLRLFRQWRFDNYMPFYDERGPVPKWAAADPRHAAEFVLDNPSGYVSQGVVKVVGEEWAKTDPAAALEFAAGRQGELASLLGTAALKQWAERNLSDAADWLAATEEQTRNRLSPGFVEAWAKKDAPAALAWSEENLSGSGLASAVPSIIQGAGLKQVAATAELVAGMEPSAARAAGAAAVASQWFPRLGGDAGPGGNETVKPETVAWLASLDPASIKRVLNDETWSWATSDPKSMANFLLTLSNEAIPEWTETILARQMATRNPAAALDWASRLPATRAQAAGGEAYATWWSSQRDAATQWLSDLPADDSRRQPFFEASLRQLAYDPRASEQFAAMTADERTAARSVIEKMSLPEDRRATLLSALTSH
jgi:hypothetical protein